MTRPLVCSYVLNWTDREDRRNTQLTAVGSADNLTGYVFGMHLNFDPAPNLQQIEFEAIRAGDFDHTYPYFRRYARFWLDPDFSEARTLDPIGLPVLRKAMGATARVREIYD